MSMARKPDCGICGATKVKRRGRLVCQPCQSRHQMKRYRAIGSPPSTPESRAIKAKSRNTIRPSGLTNGQVHKLKQRYGISEALYLKIRQKSRDSCAICGAYIPKTQDGVLDHDAETGQIRGILCRKHNLAIGLFAHNPAILIAAADYLTRYSRGHP